MPKKKTPAKDPLAIMPEEILPSLFRSNMLRMVLTKHIELNKMADNKANMLMIAASLVITVIISDFRDAEVIGASIILASSILTVIIAIFTIKPRPYHKESHCKNLLYFRSFSQISEEEYVQQMKTLLSDKERMYEQYIRDIYNYGSYTLKKRYDWLRVALLIFLIGLTVGGAKIFMDLYWPEMFSF